jgi:transmembrane sensor
MEYNKEKLLQLLGKDELSAEESDWLLNYIENTDQQELKEILTARFENDINAPNTISPHLSNKILAQIHQKIDLPEKRQPAVISLWVKRMAVAAAVIGIMFYAGYSYFGTKSPENTALYAYKSDVKPGAEKAILTLADGSKIMVDEMKNGAVINQGNSKITKTIERLIYHTDNNIGATAFNTLSTPRAGHSQVELPDGTRVWLNVASSIHYPTVFTGDKRVVEITGEAYFEVAKNKKMPFFVRINQSEVRVYGTHFNVNAYNDEAAVKTTLLEGSVKCTSGTSSVMLKPGQQSELKKDGQFKVSAATDINNAVAWKNGYFHFEDADIETVMRQLARAYDVNVVYHKKTNDRFFAEIPVKSNLSVVLKALELTGKVSFAIDGRQVNVNP